jgi:cytochrome c oxidase cbb3-type subunit 3
MKPCLLLTPAILLLGCGNHVEQFVRPDEVTDLATLFASNCAGCHGDDGRFGAARPLHDPLFLAVIGKQTLRNVIASGVSGSAMPAFAQGVGGGLTDRQIDILADEIENNWSRPQDFASVMLPPYHAEAGSAPGSPQLGEAVFSRHCASCHGLNGAGTPKAGSVVDPAFLALASDQSLRTTVIAGRSDRGMPDFRTHSPAITSQEVSDVVAWISGHRETVNLTQRESR